MLVDENANVVAAQQIRQLLPRLGRLPLPALFAFDGGYDPVQLTVETAGTGAQIVIRVRDDRVFHARPPQRLPGGRGGAPRRHGARLTCADPDSRPAPDTTLEITDDVYGRVSVAAWHQLHPKQRTYREPGGALSIIEGTLIRLHVTRLPGRRDREPKTVWLWWHGDHKSQLDLDRIRRAYPRRFDIEHTFRFTKQVLGWTIPKLRTPEQADRWTRLILTAFTQLRLARPDRRPPAALATPATRTPTHARPCPAGFRAPTTTDRQPSQSPETHPTRSRTPERFPIHARNPPPSHQESPGQDPKTRKTTLNAKLRTHAGTTLSLMVLRRARSSCCLIPRTYWLVVERTLA